MGTLQNHFYHLTATESKFQMIKIMVTSPEISEKKGIGKVSGKPYHLRIQKCHAFTVDSSGMVSEFPDKFETMLDADQAPYPRGTYTLAPNSVFVNREGSLDIRARLVPFAAPAVKA